MNMEAHSREKERLGSSTGLVGCTTRTTQRMGCTMCGMRFPPGAARFKQRDPRSAERAAQDQEGDARFQDPCRSSGIL